MGKPTAPQQPAPVQTTGVWAGGLQGPERTQHTTAGSGETARNEAAGGAHLDYIHMERTMRVYPVSEAELDTLGSLTAQITIWFAVAGMAVSAGLTLYLESVLSPEATPEGVVLLTAGPVVCVVITLATVSLACLAWWKRGSQIRNIKKKSRERRMVASSTTTGVGP